MLALDNGQCGRLHSFKSQGRIYSLLNQVAFTSAEEMRVGFILVVALATLSLPCVELPECAGIYDNVSNDFIVAPVDRTTVCQQSVQPLAFDAVHPDSYGVFLVFPSPFLNDATLRDARSILNLLSVQKK